MMIATSSPLPQLPTLAPQSDSTAPDATAASHSFARLLAQRREQAVAPAPQADKGDAATAPPAQAAERPQTEPAPAAPQRGGPTRETGKSRDGAARTAAKHGDAKAEAGAADDAAGQARGSNEDAGTVDPALADWLARLQLPDSQQPAAAALPTVAVTPVTPPATAAAEAGAPASGDAAVSVPTVAAGSRRTGGAGDVAKPAASPELADLARPVLSRGEGQHHGGGADAGDQPQKAPAAAPDTREPLQTSADKLAATFAVAAPAAATPPHLPAVTAPDAAQGAAAAQQAVAAAAPGRDAAQPLPVVLNTPLAAPEFPQAMGVRIGVLAQNGIEHAELQLNPAEMGPVSVRIVVDGAQARVDFGADVAATRQAIEASLPALAGALRDAGFTLTGGGVSQHAHPQREGSGQGQAGSGGTGARGEPGHGDDKAAAPQHRVVRAGGVDLYA